MNDRQAETEIRAAIAAITAALQEGEAPALDRLTSNRAGCVHIGTDPDEWFDKGQMVASISEGLTVAEGPVRIEQGDISVHVQGDVAWTEGTGKFVAADGAECPVRTTSVFVYEGGGWRCAQSHASIGVPNDQMFRR